MGRITLDRERDIFGLVDVQPTFMPGGELAVADGDAIIPVINRLTDQFSHAFATQDWHPAGHSSFASVHSGHRPYDVITMAYGEQVLWPDHALQGSANAALHSGLNLAKIEVIIRKGFRHAIDSYSTFFENDHRTPTGPDGWLRQRGFDRIFLAGLATDFCVAWSAEDAVSLGYDVVVIEDACRGIGIQSAHGRTSMDDVWARLAALGVQVVLSKEIA
jgi:nicotinamidase/pyrazinamidase